MSGPRAPTGYDTSLKAPRSSSKSPKTLHRVGGLLERQFWIISVVVSPRQQLGAGGIGVWMRSSSIGNLHLAG